MSRIVRVVPVAVLMLVLAACGETPTAGTTPLVAEGDRATVVRVTDGDTIDVTVNGQRETVRLLGINAPERDECHYDEASDALADLVAGAQVDLRRDVTDRDRHDRLLRYVWLGDGTFVNEAMVRNGHALHLRVAPDDLHDVELAAADDAAMAEKVGRWAPDACGTASDVEGVAIAHIEYDAPGPDDENLNGEWIEIANDGETTVDLTGWGINDESASHRYTFPDGFSLDADARVRIRSGCGDDTTEDLHWCSERSAVWSNSGDTGYLTDPSGNVVDTYRY